MSEGEGQFSSGKGKGPGDPRPSPHDAPTVSGASGGESSGGEAREALPERIGRYRILGVLGEGGFGVVYQAMQEEPVRRRVALKVLKAGMDSRQVLARFRAEQQALAMMDHPGVARVLDGGVAENGRAYFAMEYVPGLPITDYCDRNRLNTAERLELLIQVCQAVQHAHQKGVIHRDLKPSNVLVELSDGRPVPKVIDFGVAKAVNRDLTERTLHTEMGQLIGTPEYMSPEQAEMTGLDIDTRTDIYSLGVLMYELLTGALPFDPRSLRSKGFAEIQRIIRESEPPKPSTRLSSLMSHGGDAAATARARHAEMRDLIRLLRGDLDWVTMKAMEKDRTRRYESAAQLAADIRRYLANEPVEARPPSMSYRARKFVRRHRVSISAAGAALALLVAALVGMTMLYREAVREKERADGEMRRANQRTSEAQAAQARAQAERDRAEFQAALTNVSVADASIAVGDYPSARARLKRVPPALRGWEWRHLARALDRAAHVITVPPGETALAVTPDSSRALVACADGSVLIVGLADGAVLRRAEPPAGSRSGFATAAINPDGRLAVLALDDGSVQVREVETLRTVRELAPPAQVLRQFADIAAARAAGKVAEYRAARVTAVAISADGALVALGLIDGGCRVVSITDGAERARVAAASMQQEGVRFAAFTDSDQKLVTVTDMATQVWSLRDKAAIGSVPAMVVSLTDTMLPTFGVDLERTGSRMAVLNPLFSQLQVWDTARVECTLTMGTFNGRNDLPGAIVRLAPGAESAAIGLAGGTIQVWNIRPPETGAEAVRDPKRLTLTLPGHSDRLSALEFAPDRTHLVSASADGTVRIWSPTRNRAVRSFPRTGLESFAFSPDSSHLIYGTEHGYAVSEVHTGLTRPLSIQADRLQFAESEPLLFVWRGGSPEALDFDLAPVSKNEAGWRQSLAELPRRRCLVLQHESRSPGDVELTDWRDGSVLRLRRPPGLAAPRASARLVVARHADRAALHTPERAEFYDLRSGQMLGSHAAPAGVANIDTALSTDGSSAVIVDSTHTLRVLALDSDARTRELSLPSQPVAVAISPDGSRIAVALSDATVRLIDAAALTEVFALRSGYSDTCKSLAFSPCGTMLGGSGHAHVHLWYARRDSETR